MISTYKIHGKDYEILEIGIGIENVKFISVHCHCTFLNRLTVLNDSYWFKNSDLRPLLYCHVIPFLNIMLAGLPYLGSCVGALSYSFLPSERFVF